MPERLFFLLTSHELHIDYVVQFSYVVEFTYEVQLCTLTEKMVFSIELLINYTDLEVFTKVVVIPSCIIL